MAVTLFPQCSVCVFSFTKRTEGEKSLERAFNSDFLCLLCEVSCSLIETLWYGLGLAFLYSEYINCSDVALL